VVGGNIFDGGADVRAIFCGEFAALSMIETLAANVAADVGVNEMVIVQLAFAASVDPQVLVCVKFDALTPLTVMPLMLSGPVPALVNVTDCGV